MLTMSDFQLITGFSVLLSGYTQLRCGISLYHWDRIIRLAWFSSITHLCCLTFLRDYFCQHRLAQLWRLPGMALLIVALCIAMIPSVQNYANHAKTDLTVVPRPHHYFNQIDHAICFFGSHPADFRDYYLATDIDHLQTKQQRAILSMIMLLFGMLSRIWRLYAMPINAYIRMRKWLSNHSRACLRAVFDWSKSSKFLLFWTRGFVYRPMLAAFLVLRISADISTSKAFEVSENSRFATLSIADRT
jgi:hypothetical protein